ncbi:MAG: hypothetical protein JOZ93_16250 [Sinobacteraceae bacterium]|nr:hypothetical protein [Nevskiaceae bacterium]
MSTTSRENGKPLSTADLARAGRRGEGTGTPDADVDYTEEEVTRLDVAQPPGLGRSKAAADADVQDRPGSSREARDRDAGDRDAGDRKVRNREARDDDARATAAPSGAGRSNDMTDQAGSGRQRDSGSRAVADRIARSADAAPARARPGSSEEALEPLFASGLAESFRERWTSIQGSFVDDPKQAVRRGDELVAEVMTNLAQGFAAERQRMEAQLDETGEGATENLRVALRRYRSFFERLLSL